jgi:hypothetical protein
VCACSPGARECETLQTVSFASRRRWPEPPAPGWDRTRLDRPTCVCRGAAIETQASDANMVTSRSRTHFPQPSPGAFPAPGSASTVAHVRAAGADQRPVLIPTIFGSVSDRRTASCQAPSAQRPYRPKGCWEPPPPDSFSRSSAARCRSSRPAFPCADEAPVGLEVDEVRTAAHEQRIADRALQVPVRALD